MSTTDEQRFAFGRNWSRFVRRSFTQERCDLAKKRILDFIGRDSMEGLDFLDIGCGSGLHSLAAWQAGVRRVHSFDYDANSVAATKLLWQTAERPANWTIERGDVLDSNYIASLGKWNFVYSWGVLHHTGHLWQAVENAQSTVADGGIFYIALYSSDVQASPEFWLEVKQKYNRSGYLQRQRMVWWYVWNYMLNKKLRNVNQFVKRAMQYQFRGMDLFTDIRDWLGGWPMEFAGDQQTVDFLEQKHGFALVKVSTGEACSEFLFRRSKSDQRALVKEFVARQRNEPVTA